MTPATSFDVRAALEDLLERDLLGPWDGPTEELPPATTPGERYLLGRLVPRRPEGAEPVTDAEQAPEDDGVEDRPELMDEQGVGLDPDDREAPPSVAAIRSRAMAASSLGLAFQVPTDVDLVVVEASWGRYSPGSSEHHETPTGRPRTVWRREPAGGSVEVRVDEEGSGSAVPDGHSEGVVIRWTVRHRGERRVVEVFLVNGQPVSQQSPDRDRLFQVDLTVTALDASSAIFLGHNDPDVPEVRHDNDPELRLLALQHRRQRLYATGRQCAVDADVQDGQARAWRLRTTCFPLAEVPLVVPGDPAATPGLLLDMARLGSPDLEADDLVRGLRPLVDGYSRWLDGQQVLLEDDAEIGRYRDVALPALAEARETAARLDRAVDLLREDPQAREAFRFANQAMARQRVRSELVRRRTAEPGSDVAALLRELDVPENRSWRPFQLAFVLLCLPGLSDPSHPDAFRGPLLDGRAQLLFFPTGGGKTEAYLGLTAYTIAVRRLQGLVGDGPDARDGTDGVAVLMRYTLRLLTAQQFQRATALICACELLRQERVAAGDTRWGDTPIRIGLWVGSSVTPNTFDEALRQLEDAAGRSGEGQVGGLQQFASCPWCGAPLDLGRDAHANKLRRRVLLHCGDPDGRCPFTPARSAEGLPAVVVDEEIYRLTPALVIGTVDKFAALPWRSATAHLFGRVGTECARHGYRSPDMAEWCKDGGHPKAGQLPSTSPQPVPQALRPPDLIIQDELHLISDALGSMVGLYETVVDRLCTRVQAGAAVRPVLVASTATVRRAKQQVQQVFARGLTVFPPPLLDAGDTFFSRRVPPSAQQPGRRYRGILAPGERLTAVEIRVMTALLEYGQLLFDQHGEAADPYLTVVDYFTSTRELAGMRRLAEDDVTDRLGRQDALVQRRRPTIAELTSRMESKKITQSLSDLERRFSVEQDSTAGMRALSELRKADKPTWDKQVRPGYLRPVDVLLATSMLQVGVDVQRLGLMVVTGQPKNMAEYIQASSRVGRSTSAPGLVVTIFQWNRPRDLAHYEHFAYEHATFGRRVEGLTTTPFSDRALDRGLAGVLVSALRHSSSSSLSNLGAHTVGLGSAHVADLVETLRARAELVADSAPAGQAVRDRAQKQVDIWLHRRSTLPVGQLGYEASTTAAAGLLREPDDPPWNDWSPHAVCVTLSPRCCSSCVARTPAGRPRRHGTSPPWMVAVSQLKPDPSRIGQGRPSQLMTISGVGAVVDLPGMSVVTRGLEAWGAGGTAISEPRLLDEVQRALPGAGITSLRAAPYDPSASDDPFTRLGVPVTTFPRWLRCPACHQLLPIDGVDQLELQHRWGRRPDLAKWVHRHCPRQSVAVSKRRACIPARFVVACANGHLDEFPYVDFVHVNASSPCPGPQLEMRDAGSTLGPRVSIRCIAGCDAQRNISEAAGSKGAHNLPRCRGRHPHLQTFQVGCPEPLKLMVLGASNLWFGVTASALHLPQADPVSGLISDHWPVLSAQPDAEVLASVVAMVPALHALRELTPDQLWSAVGEERTRRSNEPKDAAVGLLDAEWDLLCDPTTTKHDGDFLAVPTPAPSAFIHLLKQVVQVKRLREVQALLGFTRVEAPGQGDLAPARRVPLSSGRSTWVPAVERRGEGIFLQLREDAVASWESRVADHPHVLALRGAQTRWLANRERQPEPDFQLARYLLVHTLSHLLLRQVALECGYSSASIRERIYVGTPAAPTAGLLLSTAASDSEGTLGGLVALADRSFLGRLLQDALDDARTCSSDPLCAERVPEAPSDVLHAAACHACLFASETSCESGNRWLHRGVLVDIADGLAFS